ncbi:tigger transposable element-derived protein 4-like [Uloborus diversus]|uniref:tigger transposable element-derived protein 4-like n=1 Tax=Uloborus diversus TaxID=327109 RepID=UPI00240A4FAC|nr:tigger transposable element-derived protein 4-like [Uloborus diversus]
MIDYAWRNVTAETIKNSFIKAGFGEKIHRQEEVQEIEDFDIELQDSDWMEIKRSMEVDVSFEDFVNVDDSVAACGVFTDEEIIKEVQVNSEDDDDETEQTEIPKINKKDAEKATETLRNFLESQDSISEEGFTAIAKLKRIVEEMKTVNHQTLLTAFFH